MDQGDTPGARAQLLRANPRAALRKSPPYPSFFVCANDRLPRRPTMRRGSSAGGSFNGRTTDSDSVYLGSNPSPPTSQSPRLSILHRIRRKRPNSGPGGPADQGLISPPTPWRAPPCSRQKHLASLVRLGPADARHVIGADGKPLCCQYCLNDYREFSCSFLKPPRVPGSHRYLW